MTFPKYTESMPSGMYEKIITVTQEQADSSGRMRIGDLARQMQVITEQHLRQAAGMGADDLNTEGKSWVVAWTNIQIERLAKEGEAIRMRIWPGKKKNIMYVRKYAFYTMDGEPLMTTASLFLLMDQKTRAMADAPEQLKEPEPVAIEGEPANPKMKHPFPKEYACCVQRIVRPDEIDYNGHLNNSHYLDWAEDIFIASGRSGFAPRTVWVQYSKELKEGQTVALQHEWTEDTFFLRGTVDGEESFLLKMEFQS